MQRLLAATVDAPASQYGMDTKKGSIGLKSHSGALTAHSAMLRALIQRIATTSTTSASLPSAGSPSDADATRRTTVAAMRLWVESPDTCRSELGLFCLSVLETRHYADAVVLERGCDWIAAQLRATINKSMIQKGPVDGGLKFGFMALLHVASIFLSSSSQLQHGDDGLNSSAPLQSFLSEMAHGIAAFDMSISADSSSASSDRGRFEAAIDGLCSDLEVLSAMCQSLCSPTMAACIEHHATSLLISMLSRLQRLYIPDAQLNHVVRIAGLFQSLWQRDVTSQLMLGCLTAVLNAVSELPKHASLAFSDASVVFAPILHRCSQDQVAIASSLLASSTDVSDQQLANVIMHMVGWIRCTQAPSMQLWVLQCLRDLVVAGRIVVVHLVSPDCVEFLATLLTSPACCASAISVMTYILLGNQRSPSAFHAICSQLALAIADSRVSKLNVTTVFGTLTVHETLVNIAQCLLLRFPGFPDIYAPLIESLRQTSTLLADDEIKLLLAQSSWTADCTVDTDCMTSILFLTCHHNCSSTQIQMNWFCEPRIKLLAWRI